MTYESLKNKLRHIALEINKEYEFTLPDIGCTVKAFVSDMIVCPITNNHELPEIEIKLKVSESEFYHEPGTV